MMDNKVAVKCSSVEQAKAVINYARKGVDLYTPLEDICINLSTGSYGTVRYYTEEGYTIISYEEFEREYLNCIKLFEKGRWYRVIGYPYYRKCLKDYEIDHLPYSEKIDTGVFERRISNCYYEPKAFVLVNNREIQSLLPEGHPDKIINYLDGCWYKVGLRDDKGTPDVFIHYIKTIGDENLYELFYTEGIYMGKWNIIDFSNEHINKKDITSAHLLNDLTEIQQFLPEGHVDKVVKEEYVKCTGVTWNSNVFPEVGYKVDNCYNTSLTGNKDLIGVVFKVINTKNNTKLVKDGKGKYAALCDFVASTEREYKSQQAATVNPNTSFIFTPGMIYIGEWGGNQKVIFKPSTNFLGDKCQIIGTNGEYENNCRGCCTGDNISFRVASPGEAQLLEACIQSPPKTLPPIITVIDSCTKTSFNIGDEAIYGDQEVTILGFNREVTICVIEGYLGGHRGGDKNYWFDKMGKAIPYKDGGLDRYYAPLHLLSTPPPPNSLKVEIYKEGEEEELKVGDRVQAIDQTSGWGSVKDGDEGIITSKRSDNSYYADFPNHKVWQGKRRCFRKINCEKTPEYSPVPSSIKIDAEVNTIKIPLSASVTLKNTEREVKINVKQLNSIKIN